MTRHTPRPYQKTAVEETWKCLDKRPILVGPVGCGKTFMGVTLVEQFLQSTPDSRVLWLAHRRELIGQAASHLEQLGLKCGRIQASVDPRPARRVQVASVQTLFRREVPHFDLIVADECHHAPGQTFQKVFEALPDALCLGLTATPFRLDGKGLGDTFGAIVVAAHPDELFANGTLIEPVVFVPGNPSMRGVKITAGEYNLKQAAERLDKPQLIADIVKTWQKRASGRRTVCFAINVQHSIHITERFLKVGIRAEHLDAKSHALERARILARLRSGETQVVSQCQILTEGTDIPSLEVAVIARPTASLNLHIQMCGRIVRQSDGKHGALILDHAGNHLVHGILAQRIEYSLGTGAKPKKILTGAPQMKRCKKCFLLVGAGVKACPECGYAFPASGPTVPKEADGSLVEFTEKMRRAIPFTVKADRWLQIEAQRRYFKFKAGWGAHRFKAIFGHWPTVHNGELVDAAHAPVNARKAEYARLKKIAETRGHKLGWIGYRFKHKFGNWPRREDRV